MQDIIDVKKVEKTQKNKKPKIKLPKNLIWISLVILLVISVASSVFFFTKYQEVKSDPDSAITEKNTEETEKVLNNLKAILLVTETESPTVARVEDPDKLKTSNPEFYRDIQKNDYLILFSNRAIIFRESTNQIINIAPIINTQQDSQSSEETTQPATTNSR